MMLMRGIPMKLPLNAAVMFLPSLSSVPAATLSEELQVNLATHMDWPKT